MVTWLKSKGKKLYVVFSPRAERLVIYEEVDEITLGDKIVEVPLPPAYKREIREIVIKILETLGYEVTNKR